MAVSAVLFDLDGTLVDSLPDLTSGLNTFLQQMNLAPFTQHEVELFIGKGASVLLQRALAARGIELTGAELKEALAHYERVMDQQGTPTTDFFPGVKRSLQELREHGFKVALVTNKMRSMAEEFLQSRQALSWFDVLVTGSDGLTPKPAPDMLLAACRELKKTPQQCVMVGDSCNDALAARAAQLPVWLVRTGYNEGIPIDQWAQEHQFSLLADDVPAVVAHLTRA